MTKAQAAPAVTKVPAGLATAGRKLWTSVLAEYELEQHELIQLQEACRVADRLDRLAAEALAGPVTVTNFKGDQVAHPAMVEARQQAITMARLVASLRLPAGEDEGRPQRRGGARGSYGVRAVS